MLWEWGMRGEGWEGAAMALYKPLCLCVNQPAHTPQTLPHLACARSPAAIFAQGLRNYHFMMSWLTRTSGTLLPTCPPFTMRPSRHPCCNLTPHPSPVAPAAACGVQGLFNYDFMMSWLTCLSGPLLTFSSRHPRCTPLITPAAPCLLAPVATPPDRAYSTTTS